jgi:hypothetical protein
MVMSESEAVSKYRDGLNRVGEAAYREASNADNVTDAAEALENAAPSTTVDFSEYASSYRDKY